MTKKRLALIAALPLAIAAILGVLAMLPTGPGITAATFKRIEKGMTQAEVEKIFGGSGQFTHAQIDRGLDEIHLQGVWVWNANDGSWAIIAFEEDRVYSKRWNASGESIIEKTLRSLHLL